MEGFCQGLVLLYTLLQILSFLNPSHHFVYQLCAHGTVVYVFPAIWVVLWIFLCLLWLLFPNDLNMQGVPAWKAVQSNHKSTFATFSTMGGRKKKKNLIKLCVSESRNLQCSLDHLTKSVPIFSCHSSVTETPGNNWILMKVCCALEFKWDVW